jgi:ubiquinone/menaquinone biosynthesis C-methylase UbiE
MRALDVGSGPGALTAELVQRLGGDHVGAADPSESFVAACAERFPEVEVKRAAAEGLPWRDHAFDAALAQLVVNFMSDPVAGVREMHRVTRPGGVVAACTWDYREGMRMLRAFWETAAALDPKAPDEGRTMTVRTADDLRRVWDEAALEHVETSAFEVEVEYESFDDYWEPFTAGAGPAGAYCVSLDPDRRAALREGCRRRLGDPRGAFRLRARAWAVRGRSRQRPALDSDPVGMRYPSAKT